MIQDPKIIEAVSSIIMRSERQAELKLLDTYFDVGLLPQLKNSNHQIVYGRRGTGKTHVMKVLEFELLKDKDNIVVYIDCRSLGSTSQFSDSAVSMPKRCIALFRDFLISIHYELQKHIVEKTPEHAEEALDEADNLLNLITEPFISLEAQTLTTHSESSKSNKAGMELEGGASMAGPTVGVGASLMKGASQKEEQKTEYVINTTDKVVFPELQRGLNKVLELAESRLFIIVDEWSSLPKDIQPYLAEFLKRGVLPIKRGTMKVAALEYRCRFNERNEGNILGFELGADISTAADLDDYFVYDRNPDQITDIYATILLQHLSSELPPGYLKDKYSISTPAQLASRLFTERKVCSELARASEGVIRDLMHILNRAFFDAHKRGRDNIDKRAILESARRWFEQDKSPGLEDHLRVVLQRIVAEVIGKKKARSFLLPRVLEREPVIQMLLDSRVLHRVQRGYADKDNPGVRYNIYAIDYGAYVDLIDTKAEPKLGFEEEDIEEEFDTIVPFDDKRSIRRIVLDRSLLT